jgi:hypothetical protein
MSQTTSCEKNDKRESTTNCSNIILKRKSEHFNSLSFQKETIVVESASPAIQDLSAANWQTEKKQKESEMDAVAHLSCIICYQYPSSEIWTCGGTNSTHVLCKNCFESVCKMDRAKCPMCRSDFSKTSAKRNVLAEELLSSGAIKIPCENEHCEEKIEALKWSWHRLHECEHRLLLCENSMFGCTAWIESCKLQEHQTHCRFHASELVREAFKNQLQQFEELKESKELLECHGEENYSNLLETYRALVRVIGDNKAKAAAIRDVTLYYKESKEMASNFFVPPAIRNDPMLLKSKNTFSYGMAEFKAFDISWKVAAYCISKPWPFHDDENNRKEPLEHLCVSLCGDFVDYRKVLNVSALFMFPDISEQCTKSFLNRNLAQGALNFKQGSERFSLCQCVQIPIDTRIRNIFKDKLSREVLNVRIILSNQSSAATKDLEMFYSVLRDNDDESREDSSSD